MDSGKANAEEQSELMQTLLKMNQEMQSLKSSLA